MSKRELTQKQKTILEIEEAAQHLPETLAFVKKSRTMSGADLILLNKKTVGGEPINPQTIYQVNMPEWRPVNHKDEMVKIYTEARKTMDHQAAYTQVCDYITKIKSKHQSNGKKEKQHA